MFIKWSNKSDLRARERKAKAEMRSGEKNGDNEDVGQLERE